jgi:hypothetical protein
MATVGVCEDTKVVTQAVRRTGQVSGCGNDTRAAGASGVFAAPVSLASMGWENL